MNFLTSLRGIAAFLVVLYHIKDHLDQYDLPYFLSVSYQNGYLAVDFFFILSGFIIFYIYGQKFRTLNMLTTLNFFKRRFARIYPLHLLIMLLYVLIPLTLALTGRRIDADVYSLDSFFIKVLLLDTWAVGSGYWTTWNVPSWTISAEMFAYLLFPFIAWVILRLKRNYQIGMFILVWAALSLVFASSNATGIGSDIGQFALLRCGGQFILGALICQLVFGESGHSKRTFLTVLSIAAIAGIALGLKYENNIFYVPTLFSLILAVLLVGKKPIEHLFGKKAFVYFGDISYSVYLSHTFIRDVLFMAFIRNGEWASPALIISYIVAVLVFSAITFKYVEMPARRYLNQALS